MLQPLFADFPQAYKATISYLLEAEKYPSRTGVMHELIGGGFALFCPNSIKIPVIRKLHRPFIESFTSSIVAGAKDTSCLKDVPERALQFLVNPEDAGLPANFSVLYGPRYAAQKQLVIDELDETPTSRRAIIHVLDAKDRILLGNKQAGSLEYSCTISWQFFIRNNKLLMHTTMRSQSAVRILPIDTLVANAIHYDMLRSLQDFMPELEIGNYSVNFGSLHLFESELNWAKAILDCNETEEYFA